MATTRRNFYFPGSTVAAQKAKLELWLTWTCEEIATGKVNMQGAAADTSYQAMVDGNLPAERRRDLILNDLSILDPTTYPPRDTVRVTRTVPRYIYGFLVVGLCLGAMGCTVRGGWPRFLRPGEESDGQIRKRRQAEAQLKRDGVRPHPNQERETTRRFFFLNS